MTTTQSHAKSYDRQLLYSITTAIHTSGHDGEIEGRESNTCTDIKLLVLYAL